MSLKLSFSFSFIIFFPSEIHVWNVCVYLSYKQKIYHLGMEKYQLCDLLANVFIQLSFLYTT